MNQNFVIEEHDEQSRGTTKHDEQSPELQGPILSESSFHNDYVKPIKDFVPKPRARQVRNSSNWLQSGAVTMQTLMTITDEAEFLR